MAEQHYSEVTVAQIIARADIGRSTFYAHFETKDELLNQMCMEMFTHIFEGMDEHCITHATLETKDLTGMLAHLLYHLRDTHHGICGKLLSEGEPPFHCLFQNAPCRFVRAGNAEAQRLAHRPGNRVACSGLLPRNSLVG